MKALGFLFMMVLIICSCKEDAMLTKENIYQYELTHIDSSDLKKVRADVILKSLPLKYDSTEMINEVKVIMGKHNLTEVLIFRDSHSSLVYRMSSQSDYANQTIKKGYLGMIRN